MPTPLPAPFRLTCHCTRSGLALIPNVSSSDTRYSQEVLTNTGNALTSYHHLATSTILYFCSVCGARLSTQDNSGRISPLIGCLDSSADVATVSELGVGNIPKKPTQDDDNADSLPGRCLCGAITFAILRPPEDYYDNTVLREWIKPGRKLLTTLCFCRSCRSTTGAPYWNWTFVPRSLVRMISTSALREYKSSEKVTRRFCGACGETCFYEHAEAGDGEMWDVAFGALGLGGCEKEWFCGVFEEETGKVDRYVEGWMRGRCSYQDEGEVFLGGEVVREVVQLWRRRWSAQL